MDLLVALPAFVAAVVVISAAPGPAFALIVRRTAVRGRAYGLATILGLELCLYAWALLVASGVAVIALSEIGFLVLKIAGCIVLTHLAARSFHSWWKLRKESGHPAEPTTTDGQQPPSRSGVVVEGFAVQMASPKAAIFLLSLYPQFVSPELPAAPNDRATRPPSSGRRNGHLSCARARCSPRGRMVSSLGRTEAP